MIIDAHHHLWRLGENGHQWPTADLETIYRSFEPSDLLKTLSGTGVERTVLVQSQPTDPDTDWMLRVAAAVDEIAGIVVWCDLAAPDVTARIKYLASQPKVRGLRPMLQTIPEDAWILRPEVRPALSMMSDCGLSFDALVNTRHLPHISSMARDWPDLSIVIDHGAKPSIGAQAHESAYLWKGEISGVAVRSNVFCKLSGLFTEMAPGQDVGEATPYADHLLETFGPARLMWGSDWPVVNLAGGYYQWLRWVQKWLEKFPPEVGDAIMSQTARSFYKLGCFGAYGDCLLDPDAPVGRQEFADI